MDKRAQAVSLRLAGLTYRQIAAEVGVSPEMVRRYLKSARESEDFGLNVQITNARGIDGPAAAVSIRRYLDSIGLRRITK